MRSFCEKYGKYSLRILKQLLQLIALRNRQRPPDFIFIQTSTIFFGVNMKGRFADYISSRPKEFSETDWTGQKAILKL